MINPMMILDINQDIINQMRKPDQANIARPYFFIFLFFHFTEGTVTKRPNPESKINTKKKIYGAYFSIEEDEVSG